MGDDDVLSEEKVVGGTTTKSLLAISATQLITIFKTFLN